MSTDEKTIMAKGDGSNKRRRRKSPGILQIADLPDNIFSDVAAYLPKPSRAIFAVAMTAHPSSWAIFDWKEQQPSAAKAILSMDQYDTLDLGDIDKDLAKKLTDDDIASMLACIDAANNLRYLSLAGCVSIVGHGLEPLRNSAVITEIDLSLVKHHEKPNIQPEPSISEDAVVPILDSIVHTGSLAFLPLPKVWRKRHSPLMDRFLGDFCRLLQTRRSSCSKCAIPCSDRDGDEMPTTHGGYYGLQNYSCHICRTYFCYRCEEGGVKCLEFCDKCEREYCKYCIPAKECGKCYADVCSGCDTMKECQKCGSEFCRDCSPVNECACWNGNICNNCFPQCYKCERDGCDKVNCINCYYDDEDVKPCPVCEVTYCSECRFLWCSKDGWVNTTCSGCLIIASKRLARENEKLRSSNEQSCQEIEELKRLNEKQRKEIDELKKNSSTDL